MTIKPMARKFQKVERIPAIVPKSWLAFEVLPLCDKAGITVKLRERGWLEYVLSLKVYVNPRLKKILGRANYQKGTIELNKSYFSSPQLEEKMLQTFVHEVCHHLSHEYLEHKGHGRAWKDTMLWLGFKPERLGNLEVIIDSKPLKPKAVRYRMKSKANEPWLLKLLRKIA